jgi:RNA polymerase sigma factor (sigma-70 family)
MFPPWPAVAIPMAAIAMGTTVKPDSSQALLRLFTEQRTPLNKFFLRRTAHAWDAQDMVQEVYLRLLTADRQSEEAIRNPEAYLYTIATNLLREHATQRERAPAGHDALEDVLERFTVPCEAEAGVDRAALKRRLAQIIARLSPKCRAAMVLHYRDELGYREIAERLNISANMVKKYIVKGLTACRQEMSHHD